MNWSPSNQIHNLSKCLCSFNPMTDHEVLALENILEMMSPKLISQIRKQILRLWSEEAHNKPKAVNS